MLILDACIEGLVTGLYLSNYNLSMSVKERKKIVENQVFHIKIGPHA